MQIDNKFNLEHQYKLFLERVKLDESKMHEIQKRQLKMAFMGACGQMLVLLEEDVAAIENEEEAVGVLDNMMNQVAQYFIDITSHKN